MEKLFNKINKYGGLKKVENRNQRNFKFKGSNKKLVNFDF